MKNIDITKDFLSVKFAIATISDTRKKHTDKSGDILYEKITKSGHEVSIREIIPDEIKKIELFLLNQIKNNLINVIITTGGTGLTGRDSTPEAVKNIIEKEIEGFGELFRMISYKKNRYFISPIKSNSRNCEWNFYICNTWFTFSMY